MKLRHAPIGRDQQGFTIVELMIATAVFSLVILVITAGVLHFTTEYYHGITSSTTQGIARDVVDDISQAIQFSGQVPVQSAAAQTGYLCAGGQEFIYNIGAEVKTDGSVQGLTEYTIGGAACTATPSGTGTELLQPSMRLAQFLVQPISSGSSLYQVSIVIAMGDNDLLCDSTLPPANQGGCNRTAAAFTTTAQIYTAGTNLVCKEQTGSQFCYVSDLSTTAGTRISGN